MKTLYTATVFILCLCSHCFAAEAIPLDAKCFFSITTVKNSFSKPIQGKEGLYLYIDSIGYIWGSRYVKGEQIERFGGTKGFSDRVRAGFKKVAISSFDWNAKIAEIAKRVPDDDRISVTDGVLQEIKINFEESQCEFTALNPLSYIHGYAQADPLMLQLESILDGIAAAYGRTQLGL